MGALLYKPRWVVVAFIGRCLSRAAPLFRKHARMEPDLDSWFADVVSFVCTCAKEAHFDRKAMPPTSHLVIEEDPVLKWLTIAANLGIYACESWGDGGIYYRAFAAARIREIVVRAFNDSIFMDETTIVEMETFRDLRCTLAVEPSLGDNHPFRLERFGAMWSEQPPRSFLSESEEPSSVAHREDIIHKQEPQKDTSDSNKGLSALSNDQTISRPSGIGILNVYGPIVGNVIGMNYSLSVTQEIDNWRVYIEDVIDRSSLPANEKDNVKEQVDTIQATILSGQGKKNPSRLEKLINDIAKMSPEIFDVVIATLANPLAGIGLVLKKISDKAKIEVTAK